MLLIKKTYQKLLELQELLNMLIYVNCPKNVKSLQQLSGEQSTDNYDDNGNKNNEKWSKYHQPVSVKSK